MARIESLSGVSGTSDVALAVRDGSRSVAWLRGEHDLATAADLSKTLARAIATGDADVVLDLHAVAFMDASTVGVIISASELLGRGSRLLVLRSPSSCARRLIDLCGLSKLVEGDRFEADPVVVGQAGSASALGTWVAVPAVSLGSAADGVVAKSDPAEASGTDVVGLRRIVSDVG